MWRTIQPKFWPKKPVIQASGRKIVAITVSAFITRVQPVGDGREVDVHRAREQVAVAVDQVADPDQVVVDVAEVALVLRDEAGQVGDAAPESRANVSRCGETALRMPTSSRFIPKISCSSRSSARRKIEFSSSSMRSSKSARIGKKLSTSASISR